MTENHHNPEDADRRASSAALRRDLFTLFAGLLLRSPQRESIDALLDVDSQSVILDLTGPEGEAPLRALGGVRFDDALRREFFDLLSVPTPRYKAPFESVFCDEREIDEDVVVGGLLHGPSLDAVALAYARAGFALDVPEMPDHLGCELAFLAALCGREAEALEAGDEAAADEATALAAEFARDHPARWASTLAERLGKDAASRFYAPLVALASMVVRETAARHPSKAGEKFP